MSKKIAAALIFFIAVISAFTIASSGLRTELAVVRASDCDSEDGKTLSPKEVKSNIASGAIKYTLASDQNIRKGVGIIVNNTGCSFKVSQVTYKVFDNQLLTQEYFDYAPDGASVAIVKPHSRVELRTNLPDCMSQTDLYYGIGPKTFVGHEFFGGEVIAAAMSFSGTAANFCQHPVQTATLKLIKNVVNDGGGTKQVSDFKLFVGSTEVVSGQEITLNPGPVIVGEATLPNYQAGAWGGDCSTDGKITLQAGDRKTCTITNTFIPPTPPPSQKGCITIQKNAFNANNSPIIPVPPFTFKLDNGSTFTTNTSGTVTIPDVSAGDHHVAELVPTGWNLSSIVPASSDGHIVVAAGSNCAAITFKNIKIETTPTTTPFAVMCVPSQSSVQTGQSVTFTANPTGGTGNVTFSWSGDGNPVSTSSTVTVSFASAGTKTLSVAATSGDQTRTAQCSVTVTATPTSTPTTTPPVIIGGIAPQNPGGGIAPSPVNPPSAFQETPGQIAGVFLSQVPYTGIGSDLKVALFIVILLAWSIWLSYLIIKRKARKQGLTVSQLLDKNTKPAFVFAGGNTHAFMKPVLKPVNKMHQITRMKEKVKGSIPVMHQVPRDGITVTPHEPKIPTSFITSPFVEQMAAEVKPKPVVPHLPTDHTYQKIFNQVNPAFAQPQTKTESRVEVKTEKAAPLPHREPKHESKYEPVITPRPLHREMISHADRPQAAITMQSSTEDIVAVLEQHARELQTLISADGLEIIVKASHNNKHNSAIILSHLVELYKGSEHEMDGDWLVLNSEKINKILFSTYTTMTPVFIQWLAQGDDRKVMSFVRMLQMQGQPVKDFMMTVILELDKAYRYRIENTGDADGKILDATIGWSNGELEQAIHVLVSAIDQTYSSAYASIKIALVKVLDMSKVKYYT